METIELTIRIYKERRKEYWKHPEHYIRSGVTAYQWKSAAREADIRLRWKAAEEAGMVRLKIEPDDICDLDDLLGDCYNPQVNSDISPVRLKRERLAEIERINQEGVWGIVGQYKCPCCGQWTTADSVWGIVSEDWKEFVYDLDVMSETLEKIGR